MVINRSKKNKSSFNVLGFLFEYQKQILFLFLLSMFSSTFFLAGPYISKLFIDNAFIERNMSSFLSLSFLSAIIFVFSVIMKTAEDLARNKITIKLKVNLARKFINKLYCLDLKFLQAKSAGENMYRISDIENISNLITEECPRLMVDLIKLPVLLGISLWINFQMTVLLLVLSPLFFMQSLYLQKKLMPIYNKIWECSASLYKQLHETFSKMLIIKSLGLEHYQKRIYMNTIIKNMRWGLKGFRWGIYSSVAGSFLSKGVYGAIALYGGWLIIRGRLTLGKYTAVMLYLTQLGVLLQSFAGIFEHWARQVVSLEKFYEVMNAYVLIKDAPKARSLMFFKGDIRYENISFGHEESKPIFKKANISIPALSWVTIMGASGCGKTTMIGLMLRLYELWDGDILIDGIKIKDIQLRSLRNNIAVATQQPLLFDTSIRGNIAYGLKNIKDEEIKEAAKVACVHDYILQLPKGYDTEIGDDAYLLSHGLKQRLALARAIARKPALLILDEAASSVDMPTENRIFKNLKIKRAGMGTIVITHRPSCVEYTDKVFFFTGNGGIEYGTHDQLLSDNAAYKRFLK
jgi:ATP-binding cassette, subfamily B, bacterial